MTKELDPTFYDRVARKFGGYHTPAKYTQLFEGMTPEYVFLENIIQHSNLKHTVLDVGCADGEFTSSTATLFKHVIGIDMSIEMLKVAELNKQNKDRLNVEFQLQDASHTTFPDEYFDIVYSRRGPTFYDEFFRITKPQGFYFGISIGEHDALELKELFGRGQLYDQRQESHMQKHEVELKKAGYIVDFGEETEYFEYYKTLSDLDTFLQGVPIFQEYSPNQDFFKLEEYAKTNIHPEWGIKLRRHRFVIAAVKP